MARSLLTNLCNKLPFPVKSFLIRACSMECTYKCTYMIVASLSDSICRQRQGEKGVSERSELTTCVYINILLSPTYLLFRGSTITIIIIYYICTHSHTHTQSHRRIFQWLSYTLFFYNALLGLLAAIFRVLISTCINLLLMIRLDRPVAQQLDTGNWI